jgi:hypothetical protein
MSEVNCVIDSICIVLDILSTVPAMKSYGRRVLVFNIEVASDRTIRLRGVSETRRPACSDQVLEVAESI